MQRTFRTAVILASCLVLPLAAQSRPAGRPSAADPFPNPAAATVLAASSGTIGRNLAFAANLGHWPPKVRFAARHGRAWAWVADDGWAVCLRAPADAATVDAQVAERGVTLRCRVERAEQRAPQGEGRRPGRHDYLLGNDPGRWGVDVPLFDRVRLPDVRPGIDLVLRDGHLGPEYVLEVSPGADPDELVVVCEGATGLALDDDGSLLIRHELGTVRQLPPVAWQQHGDERIVIPCRYRLLGGDRYGLQVTGWDRHSRLVIDPVLDWSTYLGGGGDDDVAWMGRDPTGAIVLVGRTNSQQFPTTPGAFRSPSGNWDGFATWLTPDGSTLIASTYLGGPQADAVDAATLRQDGTLVAVGYTASSTFPTTTGAYDRTFNGAADTFVVQFAPSGSSLLTSTFLGGTVTEDVASVAVASNGNVVVGGRTTDGSFPTTQGAYDRTYIGTFDCYVSCLDSNCATLLWSTFLGGGFYESSAVIALTPSDEVVVTGSTGSFDFPTTPGAYDRMHNGNGIAWGDAFLAKLDATGSQLLFSTFLGGASSDCGTRIMLTSTGSLIVTGWTESLNFPTTNDTLWPHPIFVYGGQDFVALLSASGSNLEWGTYVGGDSCQVILRPSGELVIAGTTSWAQLPVTYGALQQTIAGGLDGFFQVWNESASVLLYSTLLGGTGDDGIRAALADDQGVILAGGTKPPGLPVTPGSFQPVHAGGSDVFVARIDLPLAPSVRYGTSTPACAGPIGIERHALPFAGNQDFRIGCRNAPPSTWGALVLGVAPARVPVLGVTLLIDPILPSSATLVLSMLGQPSAPLSIPPTFANQQFFAQFVWANNFACGGFGTFSSSDGLTVHVR